MASLFAVLQLTIFFMTTDLIVSETTPACSLNECEKPEAQVGLSIVNDKPCYINNDVIVYTCTGTFFGPNENYCDGLSGWRYNQPVCKEQVISCASVALPENGIITDGKDNYTMYETVDIACNSGYTLVGTARKVCDSDGEFKPSYDPICTESLSVPQPTTTLATTTTSSFSTLSVQPSSMIPTTGPSIEPSSEKPSTEPTEKRTEPPALSQKPPEENWNGLIIGLCAGVGGGILIVIVSLALAQCYCKNYKKTMVGPDDHEMNQADTMYLQADIVTNKQLTESWQ